MIPQASFRPSSIRYLSPYHPTFQYTLLHTSHPEDSLYPKYTSGTHRTVLNVCHDSQPAARDNALYLAAVALGFETGEEMMKSARRSREAIGV